MMEGETQEIIFDLPKDTAIMDAVAVVRYMDEDGEECFRVLTHNEPGDIVVLGLLRSAVVLRESGIEGIEWEDGR